MATPIYSKLSEILQDFFDNDALQATPTLMAKDVKGWNSLAQVRLLLTIEQAFKIQFSADEMGSLKNVGDLADLIAAKTQ